MNITACSLACVGAAILTESPLSAIQVAPRAPPAPPRGLAGQLLDGGRRSRVLSFPIARGAVFRLKALSVIFAWSCAGRLLDEDGAPPLARLIVCVGGDG